MSVLLLKTPGVIQTLGPVEIDPYWLRRGLQMVVDNGRVVFNREVQKLQPTTVTGGPKSQVSKFGRAMGFGTTYGLGTTDALAGSTLAPPKTGKRSIVAELNPKTSGGGTLGRVFQDASGSGLARGESFYLNAATGIVYAIFVTNAGSASQWPIPTPPALDTWSVVGFSVEFVTSAVTPGYGYINGKFVASGNNIAVAGTLPGTNPTTDLVLGNRASDGIRGWDGMQGLILIFDGFLEAKDHARLAMNRRQVFLESRAIWVGAAAGGGTTITGAIGTAVASGLTGTVNANRTISGALGTATATGFLGVVNANRTISGAFGTAVASGLAGNVYANRTIAGTLGTATASGFQGTVTNDNSTTISGSLGTAVATGFTGGVAWNRYIAGVLGVATASGLTGGVANGTAVAGRRRTSQRKILVTIKGARFLVPEDQLDEWLDDKEEEIVEQAIKPVTVVSKKARVIRANTSPVPKVAAQADEAWVAAAVAELNRRVQQRIADERKRLQDEDDEEVMLLLL